MSRGIMYHIVDESRINDFCKMEESDFYEEMTALGVDYVKDQTPEDAKDRVESLVARFRDADFTVESCTDPDHAGFYFFKTGNKDTLFACQSKYFTAAFAALQKKVNTMSLETFASNGTEEFLLRQLINNKCGDAVYYGEHWERTRSLDSFVRELRPNMGYYIAPETVYLH